MAKSKSKAPQVQVHTTWKKAFRRDWQLYLLCLLPLLIVIIFNYAAYPSLRMAFLDYKPARGYEGSEWVGLQTFQVRDFEYQLAVYIYEKGLNSGHFSEATAVGLFQSLVGLFLVLASDKVAKGLGEDGLL